MYNILSLLYLFCEEVTSVSVETVLLQEPFMLFYQLQPNETMMQIPEPVNNTLLDIYIYTNDTPRIQQEAAKVRITVMFTAMSIQIWWYNRVARRCTLSAHNICRTIFI